MQVNTPSRPVPRGWEGSARSDVVCRAAWARLHVGTERVMGKEPRSAGLPECASLVECGKMSRREASRALGRQEAAAVPAEGVRKLPDSCRGHSRPDSHQGQGTELQCRAFREQWRTAEVF